MNQSRVSQLVAAKSSAFSSSMNQSQVFWLVASLWLFHESGSNFSARAVFLCDPRTMNQSFASTHDPVSASGSSASRGHSHKFSAWAPGAGRPAEPVPGRLVACAT